LPAERYVLAYWKTVRASIDYHVEVDRHYYSVPYQLAGQKLEARYSAATMEIFHGGTRVASHLRSTAAYGHTTVSEPMPKSHQAHLEWTPSRLIHWAEGIGVATAEVVRTILERGGKVRTPVIDNRKKKTLQSKVRKHVEAGSALYTDALLSYEGLAGEYAHQVIDHAVAYVEGNVHTNGLENFWSLLKPSSAEPM
jgi:transposase-like protein